MLLIASLVSACGTAPELEHGRELAAAGRTEESLAMLEQGVRRQPEDRELRAALIRQRELAQSQWLLAAEAASQARRFDEAKALYERVLRVDAGNARALAGLDGLRLRADLDERTRQADTAATEGRLADAETLLRGVLAQDSSHAAARRALAKLRERQMGADAISPTLKAALNSNITLELRDTPLRNAFEVISRSSQLNFVFDRDVRADARVTLTVRNSPVNDVIRLLLLTQQLDRKVLNDNSLLIYPATPPKQREYQDLIARVFFLTNADAKQAQALLRALGKTREVHVDEKLNMVAIRDTPDAVRLAERLIESIDVAEPEVMMEVEVLEISRSHAIDLGINFPTELKVESVLPLSSAVPAGRIDLNNLNRHSLTTTIANPALRAGLQSQDTNVNLLANPRIRAKNHEKARVLIGEKLPVFTSTAVQNAGVASSVSYLDVGLKLEVEPTVYLDNEVGIKVNLEVNSNLERITSPDGNTSGFRLGTRTAQTNLRLRDGETQVLAGLINDNDRDTFSKLPGFGDLPGIGRAFGNTVRNRDKSEIVLLITPHVLRNITPPDLGALMFSAGTEAAAGAPPLVLSPTPPRALAMTSSGARTAAASVPSAAVAAASAPQDLASIPNVFTAQLQAPTDVSLGRDFSVTVEIGDAGTAQQGEVILEVDPALIAGGGPRVVVRLAPTGSGSLAGSISLRANAAGAGTTSLQIVGGSVRLQDGQQRPVSGGGATLRIGV
ncbi:MAG: secretin N-terminal domain-containing protein [Rhizobacter sp.]